jgi:hypothetical protein
MKIVAHPLVVAVALGLLDPGVLSQEPQDPQEPSERAEGDLQQVDGPSPEQFAQIELEWQSVRGLV